MPDRADQRWDPRRYASAADFVPILGLPVVDLLSPRPGERVLDLGCGDGRLSADIVARGAEVVGVDSSPEMVGAARARGIDARHGDATRLEIGGAFDAVFSNAALHWMRRPEAVAASVAGHLRPGGRFVGELGGHGNVATVCVALGAVLARRGIDVEEVSPWYFPTVDEYAEVLAGAGFEVDTIVSFPRPTALPGSLGDWLDTFAGVLLDALAPEDRLPARAEVVALAAPWLQDRHGRWTVDYVRLRFSATLTPA